MAGLAERCSTPPDRARRGHLRDDVERGNNAQRHRLRLFGIDDDQPVVVMLDHLVGRFVQRAVGAMVSASCMLPEPWPLQPSVSQKTNISYPLTTPSGLPVASTTSTER